MKMTQKTSVGALHFESDTSNGSSSDCSKGSFRKSHATKFQNEYPLRFILPEHASMNNCRWVYPVLYGGGLVGGDSCHVTCSVGPHCCVLITSQSSTKVYTPKHMDLESSQTFSYLVQHHGLLGVLPDPVVPYQGSRYHQQMDVFLELGANLVLLDWYTAGRMALGERWKFRELTSSTHISVTDKVVLRDRVSLEDKPQLPLLAAMGNFNVMGTCILFGPHLLPLATQLLRSHGQSKQLSHHPTCSKVVAVNPLYVDRLWDSEISGCSIRFSTHTTAEAYDVLKEMLHPLSSVFGGNPFENK